MTKSFSILLLNLTNPEERLSVRPPILLFCLNYDVMQNLLIQTLIDLNHYKLMINCVTDHILMLNL